MQPRPPFDRVLLIAVTLGIVTILGAGCTMLAGNPGKSPVPSTASPAGVSALETATLTLSPRAKDDILPTATGPEASLEPPADTVPLTGTLVTETLPPPSATPTPEGIQPLQAGKYDDTDPNIAYDPYWTPLKNPSTAISYKGTIHASGSVGNEASFRFTGERFRLGYQRGRSFGTVTVLIDDLPNGFSEQAFDLVWSSPQLSPGDHFVRIIHESGESINLDYIEILD